MVLGLQNWKINEKEPAMQALDAGDL